MSEFWFISLTAFACGALFIATLTLEQLRSADAANFALSTYSILTMFTLWLEPSIPPKISPKSPSAFNISQQAKLEVPSDQYKFAFIRPRQYAGNQVMA